MTDRELAELIIEENAEYIGPFDFDNLPWVVNRGVLGVFHPMTTPETWMAYIGAKKGTSGYSVYLGLKSIEEWFKENFPVAKKLIGFVREDNIRSLRMNLALGYKIEGVITNYFRRGGRSYNVVIVGKEL